MVQDPRWELAILSTVHSFYQKLLEECLHSSLLVPAGLDSDSLADPAGDLTETVGRMRRWLRLLDLSVSTAMLRQGLTADGDPELAEALLRYFAHKVNPGDTDRDKADFVVTFLYRNPRVPGQWESRGFGLDGSVPLPPFEIALMEVLTDAEPPLLTEHAALVLCELGALREQAEGLKDFADLVDLAVVQRGRHLKALLHDWFFHPAALANAAMYNVTLSRQFDALFRAAAGEIRNSAQSLQREGGNPWTRVDAGFTVRDVAGLHEEDFLGVEYGVAQERFRSILRVKKTLQERGSLFAAQSISDTEADAGSMTAPSNMRASAFLPSYDPSHEEARIASVAESVRTFVRAADPTMREVVPMRSFNLVLTTREADAFAADYLGENNVYGETARMLVRIVAVLTRMGAEYEELKQKQNSATLGGPHADALRFLVSLARKTADEAEAIFMRAEEEGLEDGATAVLESLDRLRGRADFVSEVLDGWRGLHTQAAGASA